MDFLVSSYAHHQGAITTMCTGPSSPGSPTPTYLIAGSSNGSLSLYPISPPDEIGSFPIVGTILDNDKEETMHSSSSSEQLPGPIFQGFYNENSNKWELNNNNLSFDTISPMIKVTTTLDGDKVCCLKENGLLTLHSIQNLGHHSQSSLGGGVFRVDPIMAYDACWRMDGSQILTVGTQQLKLWDINNTNGSGNNTRPCFHIGDDSNVPFTSVCCASDDIYKCAVGTADGDVLIYDLRMNSSSLSSTQIGNGKTRRSLYKTKSTHHNHIKGNMVRHVLFHPKNSNLLMSGSDDGTAVLTNISSSSNNQDGANEQGQSLMNYGINNNEDIVETCITLACSSGFKSNSNIHSSINIVPSSCVAMCYEPETNYFAAVFENESLSVRSRFPHLDKMARLI